MVKTRRNAGVEGWFAASAIAPRPYRTLSGDLDADVCVIGASLAGLTVARELARRGWSIVVIEAAHVGAGASARHFGLVAAGFAEGVDRIIAKLGVGHARELWGLSAAGAEKVRAIVTEGGVAGVEPVVGALMVQSRDDAEAAQRRAAQLRYFGADAEAWPTERVRAALHGPDCFQAVYRRDAFHIHPLNYLRGLAAAVEQAGGRIYENASVATIDAGGVRKRVHTAGGQVRAGHIVLAAGNGNAALHPRLAGTTLTLSQPMAATAPLGEALAQAIDFAGVVAHGEVLYRRDGERLLWAAPLAARAAVPRLFRRRVARDIGRLYASLGDVSVAHVWTAQLRYAAHRMPQVGEIAPGVWVADAFGDHVANTATMAGDLIAGAIAQGDDRWRLFSPYGLVWTGGMLGKAAMSVVLPARRVRAWAARALVRSRFASRFAGQPDPSAPDLPAPPAPLEGAPADTAATAIAEAPPVKKRPPRSPRKPATPKDKRASPEAAPREKRKATPRAPKDVLRPRRSVRAKSAAQAIDGPSGRDRRPAPGDAPAE